MHILTVNGKEYLDKALTKKKGVILVTGHFGVWEIMLAWFGPKPIFNAGCWTKAKKFGRGYICQSTSGRYPGIKMIPRKSSLEFMYEALARNNILTLASDQDAKKRGIFVKFFNLPASTPKGAGRFHLEYGSPLIFCYLPLGKTK